MVHGLTNPTLPLLEFLPTHSCTIGILRYRLLQHPVYNGIGTLIAPIRTLTTMYGFQIMIYCLSPQWELAQSNPTTSPYCFFHRYQFNRYSTALVYTNNSNYKGKCFLHPPIKLSLLFKRKFRNNLSDSENECSITIIERNKMDHCSFGPNCVSRNEPAINPTPVQTTPIQPTISQL